MFQSLRAGTPFYVFHKSETPPRVEIGEVLSVSTPQPQYNLNYQTPGGWQKQEVDIKIRLQDTTIELKKLPADAVIADFGTNGMVVSESRDAILNEIETLRKRSESVLQSIDTHRSIVESCRSLVEELNPYVRQEAERSREIDTLKSDLANLRDDMVDIKGMLAKALNKKSKED